MTRRGHNEGTITQRSDRRWEARLSLGNGLRRTFYGKTRKEVAKKLNEAQKALDDGLPIPGARLTLESYLKSWLKQTKTRVRPQTWDRYRQLMELHVIPELGRTKLVKLTPDQIESLYQKKLDKGLKTGTVYNMGTTLGTALNAAVRKGLIVRSPASLAQRPRVQRKEVRVLTVEQLRTMLVAASGDRLEAVYYLAATTGMREGEILALRWEDVDLKAGTVAINGTLKRLPKDADVPVDAVGLQGHWIIMQPKTERARRMLVLIKEVVDKLKTHRKRQAREMAKAGDLWSDHGLVFTDEVGGPVEPTGFYKRQFQPLLERAKLPPVTFHQLRHSVASLLLATQLHPAIVSALLGHAQVSTTVDVYSHVVPGLARLATDAVRKELIGESNVLSSVLSSNPEGAPVN